MKLRLLTLGFAAVAALASAGCATISEGECVAGNWADIGYRDGVNGKERGRLADYAKTCGGYGVLPNRDTYLRNYHQGLIDYCTYERGYSRGENGSGYNQVCSGDLAEGFAQGYDAGRVVYEIYQEHERLVDSYGDTVSALNDVRNRLAEDELDDEERDRLRKKARRLKDRRDNLRIDIRALEHAHDLPRYDLG